MNKLSLSFSLLYLFITCIAANDLPGQPLPEKAVYAQTIDLSGEWQFQIDREDIGVSQKWYNRSLEDVINLPGSMPEKRKGDPVTVHTRFTGSIYDSSYYFNPSMAKYRVEGNTKFPFFLTPERHYVGVAWYIREVEIPDSWKGMKVNLYLERPHVESAVWVNGRKAGSRNSLSVAHEYDLTPYIRAGKCRIAVRVDNRMKDINVGPDSHSITDQTQGNWNGIVGRLELQAKPKVHFQSIQLFPDPDSRMVNVKMKLDASENTTASITLSAESFNAPSTHRVAPLTITEKVRKGVHEIELSLPMGDDFLRWDEFSPALYRLKARIESRAGIEEKDMQFGMRTFRIDGKWFYVNGRKTMLRGTVECCCFPLTGYAPMDVASWERVFRKCREYGLNHMRFHSYCPPEAAFIAADLVGFYLQPEGPSWPNHGVSLGDGLPIDNYLLDETIRITEQYGNYPSFCMLACGNEPYGRHWVDWVSDFVDFWKERDDRRVYTGASVGGGWQWQPHNEFHVKAGARGLNWKQQPESRIDFSEKIDSVRQPFVSHETGQWCAFPDFDEIYKYTGVNKARNFEIFRDILSDNHMSEMAGHFKMASGKLQALCYKYELERTLKTPDYAGFQLLSLNDYSGQGSALVGVLNVFFEEKGYITAADFRRFCAPTVLLSRMDKFTYNEGESFTADIEIAHFGDSPLTDAEVAYRLTEESGRVAAQGTIRKGNIAIGQSVLGKVALSLPATGEARKMNLEVRIKGTDVVNDWNIWVYPAKQSVDQGSVYVTDSWDDRAKQVLQAGGNVLLTVAGKVSYGDGIVQYFQPAFWNTSWFKMAPPHTTGLFINEKHPLFASFPTSYHSDLQWWELVHNAQPMLLSDFPATYQPLVQSIDTWFLSRKLGLLMEANVLNGKLMVTSMDITSDPDKRIVARQLRHALLTYMNSDRFMPEHSVAAERIDDLFLKKTPEVNMFTKESPDELKPTNIK